MENEHEETVKPNGSAEEEEPEIRYTYFRGIPFPSAPFNAGALEEIVEFKPDPGDIFVVSYPKCGTTWAQYIVWGIVNMGAPPPNPNQMMFKYFPFLEATGVDMLRELPLPRLMKTHLPFQLRPRQPLAKYIYVMRNPWDCCVSFYHHIHFQFPDRKLSFEKFLDRFVQGKLPYGNFFDHVLSWYTHKNDSNVLCLTYENMSADPKGTLLTVAKFLGDHYYTTLLNDEKILNNCLKYSEFKYVKDMGMFITKNASSGDKASQNVFREAMGSVDKTSVDPEKFRKWDFFRKGVVGDWRNHFTKSQMRRFNNYISAKAKNSDLQDLWKMPDQDDLE